MVEDMTVRLMPCLKINLTALLIPQEADKYMVYCGWEKLAQGDQLVQDNGPSQEVRALLKWMFLAGFCKP